MKQSLSRTWLCVSTTRRCIRTNIISSPIRRYTKRAPIREEKDYISLIEEENDKNEDEIPYNILYGGMFVMSVVGYYFYSDSKKNPVEHYEIVMFGKEVLEDIIKELEHLKFEEGVDLEKYNSEDIKNRIVGLYEEENGGRMSQILMDLYGREIIEFVNKKEIIERNEGNVEIIGKVDLFRVRDEYFEYLFPQEKQKKQQSVEQLNLDWIDWRWKLYRRFLFENVLVSPLKHKE